LDKKFELLAPGGDIDSIKAAILAGADAVYCGLGKFNARNRAANISADDLYGVTRLAHQNGTKVYLTLNIVVVENELPELIVLLNKLANTGIDGVIVQDIGILFLIKNYFKNLPIHASTQLTTHNSGQILFLAEMGATRVNFSRELNLQEIADLAAVAHKNNLSVEVFVHGSHCICFSGICYMSSVRNGTSGNRGRCGQPCREQYLTTPAGSNFPLNLKDISAYFDLAELGEAGVDSLKIEGRIKKSHWVYTVVAAWREQINHFYSTGKGKTDNSGLYRVFNRDFTDGFLKDKIGKEMYIDNPRDNSAHRLSALDGNPTADKLEIAKGAVYDERTEIISNLETEIKSLNAGKIPLTVVATGESGSPLKVTVKSPENSYTVFSGSNLSGTGTEELDYNVLFKRLKALDDLGYTLKNIDISGLSPNTYLPYSELTTIKNQILFLLNGSREPVPPVSLSPLHGTKRTDKKPRLSVLLSSTDDIGLSEMGEVDCYFKLPEGLAGTGEEYAGVFAQNKRLIPWFPSVLLGDDYISAQRLLGRICPKTLVTNNLGIAFEASKMGIDWIAGPYLNITNSFALTCLKEKFGCNGAFISNELNRMQIKSIKKPTDFDLYFSIYHPVALMTSRQCLFQQVTGCVKREIDGDCLPFCQKSAAITNQKQEDYHVVKTCHNYNKLYNGQNYLNTGIVGEIPDLFSGFMVDLDDVVEGALGKTDKWELINLFKGLLEGSPEATQTIKQTVGSTTCEQYKKGI